MYNRLTEVLSGTEANYMLPFYWQHGDHYDTIPEEVERIFQSGCRALCVESRPHREFAGDGWWRDMDLILAECEKRGMKVWILDDDHFPTGHAVGQIKNHPELRKWQFVERHVDVMGPLTDALLMADAVDEDHVFLAAYAYPRVPSAESVGIEDCRPEPLCLTAGMSDHFLQFTVPDGCWRVFFFYKTRKGSSHADYIDMLREESVRVLVDTVYEAHYEHYARYFGNTLAGFFSDEPSLGNAWYGPHSDDFGMYNRRLGMPGLALPWNDRITAMMTDALGFDALPYLPALWFGLGEPTEAVRHAYMDAVTKLYRDCFTRQLGDWCEAHGVQYIGHIIEDMNAHARLGCSAGHYFRALDGQHMSGIDIVLHQIIPGMSDFIHTCSASGNNADPAFFDYVLAKLAASFAHIGTQTEGRAMCEVFGAYGWAEGTPAMKWLLDYLLVRGVNHFVPHAFSPSFPDRDCPPHFGANGHDPQFEGFSKLMTYTNRVSHLLTGGVHKADAAILYHADAEWMNYNGDAMLTQVPAKMLYDAHIDYDILPADCLLAPEESGSRVFHAEAKDGKLCIGGETYQCLIVPAAKVLPAKLEEALEALKDDGVLIFRMKPDGNDDLLPALNVLLDRDISVDGNFPMLRCCHYVTETGHVYMFVNESVSTAAETTVTLADAAGFDGCVLLDLLNDDVSAVNISCGKLTLSLAPYQSVIAVFDRELPALPGKKSWEPAGDADLTFTIETASFTDLTVYTPYADNVRADALPNITDIRRDPSFSGRIRYTADFVCPDGVSAIDLGHVGLTSRLILNGTDLGIRVCPPYRYDLSAALRPGTNHLVIEVSNTLAGTVRDHFSSFMPIPPSGLRGTISWGILK